MVSKFEKNFSGTEVLYFIKQYNLEAAKELEYDFKNLHKPSLIELYHQGWSIDTDISRAENFFFILSKRK